MGRLTAGAIEATSLILVQFGNISGLKCNFQKSNLMICGTDIIPAAATNSGFTVTTEIKLLGMNISNNLVNLEANFDCSIVKMQNTIRFWGRFNLSLMGRLNIAKTFLLSQIGYLGCFLNPSVEQLTDIKAIITDFVKGRLNFGRKRLFLSPEMGGAGMIDPEPYILALQTSWIKRAFSQPIDYWSLLLWRRTYGNIFILGEHLVTDTAVLKNVACSFQQFLNGFVKDETNVYNSFLINNPSITRSLQSNRTLDFGFFGLDATPDLIRLSKIRIWDICTIEFRILSEEEILANTGINFNLNIRLRLATAVHAIQTRFGNKMGKSIRIEDFFGRFKKGSRNIRRFVEIPPNTNLTQQYRKFFTLAEVPVPSEKIIRSAVSLWSNNFLSNNQREFLFKLHNNLLGLNVRVAHFNQNVSRGCTFCTLEGTVPVPDETFSHLFFSCPSGPNTVTLRFLEESFPELELNTIEKRKKALFLFEYADIENNLFLSVISMAVLWYIWSCKLKKMRLSLNSLKLSLHNTIDPMLKISGPLRHSKSLINTAFTRTWDHGQYRR